MPFTDAALRVSKPSGMGGARQLLGAWRGGGLPGVGDTGPLTWSPQAYLSTRTDPTPPTRGQLKLRGGQQESRRPKGKELRLPHHLQTGRASGGTSRRREWGETSRRP